MQYKISVLVFVHNRKGDLLMLKRAKSPNKGLWSPIGGKLEMSRGESPHQCAIRETEEEIGLKLEHSDLHLFCTIAEKAYEGANHWLMFLFNCHKPIEDLPETISEGTFAFHSRKRIDTLPIPETDRDSLWNFYDQYREDFVSARANCLPGQPLDIIVEQVIKADLEDRAV